MWLWSSEGSCFSSRSDGVDDRLRGTDPAAFRIGTGQFTAEAWIKTSTNGDRAIVAKGSPEDPSGGWSLVVSDDPGNEGRLRVQVRTTTGAVFDTYGATRVDPGQWHHVAFVFGRVTLEDASRVPEVGIYLDGQRDGARVLSAAVGVIDSATSALQIGQLSPTPLKTFPSFQGDIDEVALYMRDLQTDELWQHYRRAFWADAQGPPVSVSTPANASTVTTRRPGLTGTSGAHPSDGESVRVEVHPGSAPTRSPAQTLTVERGSPWNAQLPGALADGRYTLLARQTDWAANATQSNPTTFTVTSSEPATPGSDQTPPAPTIDAPATTNDSTPTLSGQVGNAAGDADSVIVEIYRDYQNAPLATFETDEFGIPRPNQTERQYAWLGAKLSRVKESARFGALALWR